MMSRISILSLCPSSDRVACSIVYLHIDDFTWSSHEFMMCKLIRRDNESYLWHAGAGIRNQTSELGQGEWVG